MGTNSKTIIDRQKQTLSIALQEVRPNMDTKSKEAVAKKVKKTVRIVDMYLGGYVGKVETAQDILDACRKNIIKREQKLSNHAA